MQEDLIKGEKARKALQEQMNEVEQAGENFRKVLDPVYKKAEQGVQAVEEELKKILEFGHKLKDKIDQHKQRHQEVEELCIEGDRKIQELEKREIRLKSEKEHKEKELEPLKIQLEKVKEIPTRVDEVPKYQAIVGEKTAEIEKICKDLLAVQDERVVREEEIKRNLDALKESKEKREQSLDIFKDDIEKLAKVAEVNPLKELEHLAQDLKEAIKEPLSDPARQKQNAEMNEKYAKKEIGQNKFGKLKTPIPKEIITEPIGSISASNTPSASSRQGKEETERGSGI